jgi:hypothetical protein
VGFAWSLNNPGQEEIKSQSSGHFQPHLDELEHVAVNDTTRHRLRSKINRVSESLTSSPIFGTASPLMVENLCRTY